MAAVEATTVEAAAMEAATVETTAMPATVPAAAEAETDHRSADIGRAIAAIVGVVIGAVGITGPGRAIGNRRADTDKHAGRSRRSDGRSGARHQNSTKS